MDAASPTTDLLFNRAVADSFRELATVLQQQDSNPFRINAYIRAAATLDSLQTDVREILRDEGHEGLIRLPGIGRGLASSIEEIARTGRLSQLDRLRGTEDPEQMFLSIPGIGPELSHTIHETLHIDSLEALELAAHDGRLATVPGIGARRLAGIKAGLASLLQRRIRAKPAHPGEPPAALLLEIDREYREKAAADALPRLAPRRFNPDGKAWLPVLHANRDGWHFTALFSNTARAHELGHTRDWVVVYFYDDDHAEGQCTIVTETRGGQRGQRVIRGREDECGQNV